MSKGGDLANQGGVDLRPFFLKYVTKLACKQHGVREERVFSSARLEKKLTNKGPKRGYIPVRRQASESTEEALYHCINHISLKTSSLVGRQLIRR